MKKTTFFILLAIVFCFKYNVISASSSNHDKISNLPQIMGYKTEPNYPRIGNWICIPPKEGTLKIIVDAKNVQEMSFWIIPTGTGTYKHRKLLGIDRDGKDGWSILWKHRSRNILNHIEITATNDKGEEISDIPFNVITCE